MVFRIFFTVYLLSSFGTYQIFALDAEPVFNEDGEPDFGNCSQTSFARDEESRIINGENARPNSWPWMVSLRRFLGSHFCGGALIHERYVLTAAHCLDNFPVSSTYAVVGLHNVNSYGKEQVYEIEEMITHELYNKNKLKNGYDIALIKLKTAVNITNSSNVDLLCLPSKNDASRVVNENVITAGWGTKLTSFSFFSSPSEILKQAELTVANNDSICQNYKDKVNLNRLYCLYDTSNTTNPFNITIYSQICYGDTGGPFFYQKNDKWYIYGIASFVDDQGTSKCIVTNPSFFTSVPLYIDWIVDKVHATASANSFYSLKNTAYIYFFILFKIIVYFNL